MIGDARVDHNSLRMAVREVFPFGGLFHFGGPDEDHAVYLVPMALGGGASALLLSKNPDAAPREGEPDGAYAHRLKRECQRDDQVLLIFPDAMDAAAFVQNGVTRAVSCTLTQMREDGVDLPEYDEEQTVKHHAQNLALRRLTRAHLRALADGDRHGIRRTVLKLSRAIGYTQATYAFHDHENAAAEGHRLSPLAALAALVKLKNDKDAGTLTPGEARTRTDAAWAQAREALAVFMEDQR